MRRYIIPLLILTMVSSGRADAGKGDPVPDLVQGNNRFAFDLYGRLREQSGNLFLSPYSISTALAMTYAGARGETAEQMAETLHFPLPPERLQGPFGDLSQQINGPGENRPYTLSVANALWGQEDDHFLPEFIRLLEAHYGAGLRQVDFRSTEQARRTINAWVEEQTEGKIKEILKPPYPSPDTSLVLTNAIYFKGDWSNPFPKNATRVEDFTAGEGQKVRVPLMHQTGRFKYHDGGTFEALELPYAGDALSMVVLLPKKTDDLANLEGSLTAAKLDGLRPRHVAVAMPRFKMEAGFELQDELSGMGMPVAFGGKADFSGINGQRDLFISAVIHKAYVDVNEEGTEAAAATAVVMPRLAIRPEPVVSFRADHPFVFVIRDNRSGSILFLGRVMNPKG